MCFNVEEIVRCLYVWKEIITRIGNLTVCVMSVIIICGRFTFILRNLTACVV